MTPKLAEKIAHLERALDFTLKELPYTGRDPKAYRRACIRRDKLAARLKAARAKGGLHD
jgi:hypothetical protein